MKKRINGKVKDNKKTYLRLIVIAIFLFYFCAFFNLKKENYLYIESGLKSISSKVNYFFINKLYSNNTISKEVINIKYNALENENNELRDSLELKEKKTSIIFSEITNRTSKEWFSNVVIDKGYNAGIKTKLPVINSSGLIGFVSKTSKYISEISLLTNVSENNIISVIIKNSNGDVAGLLSQYDAKDKLFKITDIMSKNNVSVGDNVVLSGYNNKLYKDIYIGKVVKEETSNYGLVKNAWVMSDVNFDDLLFVAIIKEDKK